MRAVILIVAALAVAAVLTGVSLLGVRGLTPAVDEGTVEGADVSAERAFVLRQKDISRAILGKVSASDAVDRLEALLPFSVHEERRVVNLLRTYRADDAQAIVHALVSTDERLRGGYLDRWLTVGGMGPYMADPK